MYKMILRNTAFKTIAKIYIRYIVIYQNLDLCYDQMVHPQKRLLLRTLLDSTIGRIIELKVNYVPYMKAHLYKPLHIS